MLTLAKTSGAAAFSACVAEFCTIPMDTVKVRLQMQTTVKSDSQPIISAEMKE